MKTILRRLLTVGGLFTALFLSQAGATPTISITSPASGSTIASVSTPAGFTISATATATSGASIASVQFFDNGISIGTVGGTSPFSINWIPAAAGSHTLTATVTDNSVPTTGTVPSLNTATATSIVTVTTVRTVTVTAPAAGSAVAQNSSIFLRSSALFSDSVVASVQFKVDGANVGSPVTSAPYNAAVVLSAANGFTVGAHNLTAVATNGDGSITITSPASVLNIAAAIGTAPTISLSTSASGGVAPVNQNVTLSASAADTDGFIPSTAGGGVTFYVDGDPVSPAGTGETNPDLIAPYSITWKPTVAKAYSLQAQTIDDKNNIVLSSVVTVTATAATVAPTVTLTSPTAGATLSINSPVSLTATAAANSGATVTKVDFLSGTTVLGTATSAPYTFNWTPTAAGAVSLTARVTDSNAAVVTSTAVSATVVTSAPTVAITAPTNGAQIALGTSTSVTASAVANGGAAVSRVDFFSGTTAIGTALTAPFSISWAPSAAGVNALTARVTDSNATVVTSAIVNVNITAPSVTITSPAAGATATVGTPLSLTATASAVNPATVSRVEFFAGATLVGTATTAPYTITWTPTTAATVSLTARVTDSNTAAVTSSAVSITVGAAAAPTVTLTAPLAGAVVTVGGDVALTATATPGAGATVGQVQFLVGTTVVGTATSAPYTVNWVPSAAGNFSITARVVDSANTTVTSSAVTVTAVVATTVTLTAASTATVGTASTLTAVPAATAGATITQVAFFANGVAIGSPVTAAPYTLAWTPAAAGTVQLTARATDSLGVTATSAAVGVTVSAGSPTVVLTAPALGAVVSVGSNVTLSATATAPAGATVAQVQFLAGTTVVGTVTAAPYTVTWIPATAGNFSLTARVLDSNNTTVTSSVVTVTAVTATSVALTAPAANSAATVGTAVNVTASATASAGATITQVAFFANGIAIGSPVTTAPYTVAWTPSAAGTVLLTARATDSFGVSVTSSAISVTVSALSALPTVALTAPQLGSVVTLGNNVTLTASATAPTGASVAQVQFLAGTTVIGTATTAPYTVTWVPTTAGNISLTARVLDSNNTSVTSTAVTVTAVAATSVSLSANSTATVGTASTLTATATASAGATITQVAFFANGVAIGSAVTTAPYTVAWTPTAAGTVLLTARATDSLGVSVTSSSVSVAVSAVTASPTVALTTPLLGTVVTVGNNVTVSATATAPAGATVAQVQFVVGTTVIGTVTAAPYSVTWVPSAAGNFSLTARVLDSNGTTVTSTAVTVTAVAATSVSLAASATATVGTASTLTATATASAGATITQVAFFANGVSLGATVTTAPYIFTWTPTTAGTVLLTARATDSLGVTVTSTSVSVSVAGGTVSSIALTAPVAGATAVLGSPTTLTATATAASGATVTRVDFYANGALVGTDSTAPYSVAWTPAFTGATILTAQVTDSTGVTATTAGTAITVALAVPPTVTLTTVGGSSAIPVGSARLINADVNAASTGAAAVDRVEFLFDGVLVATDTTAPFNYVFVAPNQLGAHQFTARIVDVLGQVAGSPVLGITIVARSGNAPTIGVSAPAAGAFFPVGTATAITGTALDSDGTITSVQAFANGVSLGAATLTGSAWSIAWTPATLGVTTLTAIATDDKGNATITPDVTVTVTDATSPAITLSLSPGVAPATTLPVGATRYALATVTPAAGRAIVRVEFFVNGTKVAERTTAPYTYKYTAPAALGAVSLAARATDNAGLARDAQLTLAVVSAVGAAPTVNLVSPSPGFVVTPNTPASLAATAAAPGGTITGVQFYAGGLAVGAPVTTSPFTSTFTPTAPGTYAIEAIATDDRNNTAVSSTVTLTAAFGTPTITLTAPRDGARVTPAVPVTLTATAVGGSGATVALVEFFLDGALLGTDTTAPYAITWTPDASQLGAHALTARVTDANSLTSTSTVSTVTVASVTGSPPTVSITAPANNANLQTLSTVNLVANAFDTDGTISSVEFYLADASIGVATRDQTSNVYRLVFNLANVNVAAITPDAQGRYPITLYAIARDNSGNQSISTTINLLLVPSVSSGPAISISASITTVTAGTPLILLANASDADGAIASVQYFANGVAIAGGTSTTSPYTVTYTPTAAGRINVYGVATDDTGNTAVSTSVVITVTGNNAPSVALSRPTDNATVSTTGVPVFLEAIASDADVGQTLAVIFLGNGAQIATGTRLGTTNTYRAVWTPNTANTYAVTARATDSANAATTSAASRTVLVNNLVGLAPTVTLNSPGNGTSVTSASTADFRATATDADGIITSLEFFVNRVSIGQATRDQTSNLWRTTGTFGSLNPGAYDVVAIATDSSGNLAASGTNTLNVTSATSGAPTINIASDKLTVAFSQPVQLSANAFDVDGTIASVQYFANGTSVGTSTTAPAYLINWTATASGAFNVYAVATDNTGNTALATPISVTVKRSNPLLDDDAFILQTYQDILVRNPNSIELANYSAQLAAGTMSRAQLTSLLASDPSFVNVTNLCAAYYLLMNEWPSYTNYQTLFVSRANLATVVGQILGSAEYIFKYGSVTAATLNASYANAYTPFASRLWQTAFGRGPSALEFVQFHDNDTATANLGRGYTVAGLNTAVAEFITLTNSGNTSFRNLARAAGLHYQLIKSQPTAAQITALAALPDTTAVATSLLANSGYTYRYVTITGQPASLTVAAKSGALFRVEATGQPPLAYQWLFNGAPIAGATSPLLSVTNVDTTKTGSYTVVITSSVASATSDPAVLTLSTAPTRLGNISSRGIAGNGANVLTAGFVITGTATKQMLIRVVGPSLSSLGIAGFLPNPNLTVVNSAGATTVTNDNWGTQAGGAAAVTAITQATTRVGAFALPANSLDAVVLATLNPGSYSVQASGAGTTTGVAIIEVYDASTALTGPKAVNVSTRAAVGTGENILIAGFVVNGTVSRRVLIRGVGPTLANFGLPAATLLPNPQLKLLDAAGKTITTNDDWAAGDDAAVVAAATTAAGAFPLANGSKDSAILIMLTPGAYSAQLSGVGGTANTGIGLIEVYDVDP